MANLTEKQTQILSNIFIMFPMMKISGLIYRKDLAVFKEQSNVSWSDLKFITDKKCARGVYPVPSSS